MKKRIAMIATAVILAATLIIGGTLAFFTDKGAVQNVITMGDVRITLTEPSFAKSTGGTFKLNSIMPGQKITKDPTVTNTGSHDAYIRCKLTIDGLNTDQSAQLVSGLNIGENWAKSGDYYYFQSKLITAKDVKFFDTVTIPEQWNGTVANKEFTINISAEAIQADNFTPHMTGNMIDGWKYSNSSDVAAQSAPSSSAPLVSE
jgi:predicted ribosomally synthesized peptide with SipW-like signal peptide